MLSAIVDLINGSLGLVSIAISTSHSDISGKLNRVRSLLDSIPATQQVFSDIRAGFKEITDKIEGKIWQSTLFAPRNVSYGEGCGYPSRLSTHLHPHAT